MTFSKPGMSKDSEKEPDWFSPENFFGSKQISFSKLLEEEEDQGELGLLGICSELALIGASNEVEPNMWRLFLVYF